MPLNSPSAKATPPVTVGRRQSTRRWVIALGALVLTSSVLIVGTMRGAPEEPPPLTTLRTDERGVTFVEGAPQWEYVTLAVAEEVSALPPLPAPARVSFDHQRTANIGTPLTGRIEQVAVSLGDTVEPGNRLFSVRSREFAELDKEIAIAREAVNVKQRLYERAQELFELNAVPEKEVLGAKAELKEAQLALKAAEAKQRSLSIVAAGDNTFWVRAPRAGTVVSLNVFVGQEVTQERDEPLLQISDIAAVVVVADVPELDAADLRVGSEAMVRTRDGVERPGTIQHISAVVDPRRQTVGVRVRVENHDRALKPNAFVEVTFQPHPERRVVQVVEDAVVTDGDRATVFVLTDAQRLEKQNVQTGRRRNGVVEIRSGLASGSQYAAKGALLLLNQIELGN